MSRPVQQSKAADQYRIACLLPMSVELAPLKAMLDETHEALPIHRDHNVYVLGKIGDHNIVMVQLPSIGNEVSAAVATQLLNDFPAVSFGLLVGIGGGIPGKDGENDIRLGDIVVSMPSGTEGGVVQLDRGKRHQEQDFERTGHLNRPPPSAMAAVHVLQADAVQLRIDVAAGVSRMLETTPYMRRAYESPPMESDRLFDAAYEHDSGRTCDNCVPDRQVYRPEREGHYPYIHYGTIGSSNSLLRNAVERDKLRDKYHVMSVEMEAAGVMNILPCLVVRGICDYADSHKNKTWQPYAAAVASAYAKRLLQTIPVLLSTDDKRSDKEVVPNLLKNHFEGTLKILHDSLAFERMGARYSKILDPLRSTCRWLFQDEKFKAWAAKGPAAQTQSFFWIKGHPGSGKSTTIKAALRWTQKTHPKVVIDYFFNARAVAELERSSLGLYRSLTYQLLGAYQNTSFLHQLFLERFAGKIQDGKTQNWMASELRNFLLEALDYLGDYPLYIFIDALDEGEEKDVRDLVAFLKDLASAAIHSNCFIRICLASRHYPHITISGSIQVNLEDQPDHGDDIRTYVHAKLDGYDFPDLDKFQESICHRSRGVFLWVVLVIRLLQEAYDRGSLDEMFNCMEAIPEDLGGIFQMVLERSNENLQDCFNLLRTVLYAKESLSPLELITMMKSNRSISASNLNVPLRDDFLRRHILHISRGLVEVKEEFIDIPGHPFRSTETVQFIHESVREFLLRSHSSDRLQLY